MPAAAISVIVPARDAAATLGATLEGLAAQDAQLPFEVIVVDDGSRDATAAVAARGGPAVRLVTASGNGPGPARNAGVAAASGEVIAFIDADCVPSPGWLGAGIAALRSADLVQGAVHADPRAAPHPFDRTIWVTSATGFFEGASLFCRRDLFERLGGFEDWLGARLGKPLAEDTWFGWRARRLGARVAFCDAALVHHHVFRRGALAYVAERARLVYFPALVRKMPELRTGPFAGIFLSRRSAAFDVAVASAVIAAVRRSPPALIGTLPWTWVLIRDASRWRGRAPGAALAAALADAISLGALAAGSVRARSLLI